MEEVCLRQYLLFVDIESKTTIFLKTSISFHEIKRQWNFLQCIIWKFFHLEKISCERAPSCLNRELHILLFGFTNQSFCWSDILRDQPKSNWTVGETLLISDQWAVSERRLILFKRQSTLWQFIHYGKMSVKEFLAVTRGFHDSEPVISLVENF